MRRVSPSEVRGSVVGPADESLQVRLFGVLDLRVGDAPLAGWESARLRSLLGYVVLHRETVLARQHVAFLLWPDSTEAQARTNLRKALHTLRREAPEVERCLEITPQSVRWRPDRPCWLDVEAFESAIAVADMAGADAAAAIGALRRAVDLYVGDLLEGCYDEWLFEVRERFRERYVAALARLGDLLVDDGQHAEAIRVGRMLVRADPLREDAYRQLMRAHAGAGDRAAALRVYHECSATLQRELGVTPGPVTRSLYEDLTVGDAQAEPGGDGVGASTPGEAGLVGRHREWGKLLGAWRRAEAGERRLVLVTGEAGVGKTRLVEEFGSWVARCGAVVATARSYSMEGELGFGAVISWLRTGTLADLVGRTPAADRVELARLLPELGGSRLMPEAVDAAEQRRRLFEAVGRLLAASGRPTLLVADDAQWCDEHSLQLIHYLVRLEPPGPLLIVATARREDLDEDHPLTKLVGGLVVLERATEVAVERLGVVGTGELARQLVRRELDQRETEALHAETEGNPLFIVETVRGGWDASTGAVARSPKLQAVIAARLARLSEPARELAGVAAVVGREFTADLVGAAAGVDEDALVRGIDELWRRGLVRERATDAYDFSHPRIRDAAYELLSPATRRRHHLAIAALLGGAHAAGLDAASGQVAGHYDRAGHPNEAIGWYRQAAEEALRRHASLEAVRLLERARQLVEQLGSEAPAGELEILSVLPTALVGVDGFASPRIVEVQQRAAELAQVLGVALDPVLLRSMVMSRLCAGEFDAARSAAGELRASADRSGDEGLLIESDYLVGVAAFWGADFVAARDHFERVVERFDPRRRADHQVRFGQDPQVVCLTRLGNTLWFLGDADGARRARDDGMALAREASHPYTRAVAHVFATLVSIDLGDEQPARGYAAALEEARPLDRPTGLIAEAAAGYLAALDGRSEGIDRIHRAIESSGGVDHAPGLRAVLMRLLVAAHAATGPADALVDATDQALGLDGSRIWEPEIRRQRSLALARAGASPADVSAELARAAEVAHRQGARGPAERIEQARSRLGLAG